MAVATDAVSTIHVRWLDGFSVSLDVSPDFRIGDIQPRLAAAFGEMPPGCYLRLLAGTRLLSDNDLVKEIGGAPLYASWMKAPIVEAFGSLEGGAKYAGGSVLAVDGRIYFAPCDALQVLRVDPTTLEIDAIGPELQGNKYLVRLD